jgi:hypothetical protein
MEKTMKQMTISAAAFALCVALAGHAWAHGEAPKHGGIMQTVSDISFELVNQDGKATIYVEDHGKEVATAGASGKLTTLNGKEKTEVPLAPSGTNAMTSSGDARLSAGSKVIASMTLPDKRTVNVRFSVK